MRADVGWGVVHPLHRMANMGQMAFRFLLDRGNNSSHTDKNQQKSRERRHYGKRHLRRPQGSGLREFIAAAAAATVLSDFGADRDLVEPAGLAIPTGNLPNLPDTPPASTIYSWMLEARQQEEPRARSSKPEGQGGAASPRGEADVFHHQFPPRCASGSGLTLPTGPAQ